MIFDHRTYDLFPGKMDEYLEIYAEVGWPVQVEYLGYPQGWFISQDIGELNQIISVWQYVDLADRERRRLALFGDPRWKAYVPRVAPLFLKLRNKIVRSPEFVRVAAPPTPT